MYTNRRWVKSAQSQQSGVQAGTGSDGLYGQKASKGCDSNEGFVIVLGLYSVV